MGQHVVPLDSMQKEGVPNLMARPFLVQFFFNGLEGSILFQVHDF